MPPLGPKTIEVTHRVVAALSRRGIKSALIGALAVAVRGHARATLDSDLATDVDPFTQLQEVAGDLRVEGFQVEMILPDSDDPLGGVLRVTGPDFDTVEVVNFYNPLRFGGSSNPGGGAIESATQELLGDARLPVVDLAHLVALKLYAGGRKSTVDVIELLTRNPKERDHVREVCARYGLENELARIEKDLAGG